MPARYLVWKAIPANKPEWKIKEIGKVRERMVNESYVKDGVLYWKSNDAVIPPFVYDDALVEVPAAQKAAYDVDTAEFMKAYRTGRANRSKAEIAEERAEARAAHGPGVKLVNVITGESYTT